VYGTLTLPCNRESRTVINVSLAVPVIIHIYDIDGRSRKKSAPAYRVCACACLRAWTSGADNPGISSFAAEVELTICRMKEEQR
jgi:hypothetical protein